VHAAALPGGLVQDLRDRLAKTLMGIGDHRGSSSEEK
jgi:hypothetical protein